MTRSVPPSAVHAALAPLLLAQALGVRARALRLPEPPGPRRGITGRGPPQRLLIVGDSSAAGVGASHQSRALTGRLLAHLAPRHEIRWRLEARTGASSASTLAWLAAQPPAAPGRGIDVAILVLGVNDVTRLTRPRRWIARQEALHALLRQRFRTRRILRPGLPPMGDFPLLPQPLRRILGQHAARLDTALAMLCAAAPDLTHVPLALPFAPEYVARDGFHPSEQGYAAWAAHLAPHIFILPQVSRGESREIPGFRV